MFLVQLQVLKQVWVCLKELLAKRRFSSERIEVNPWLVGGDSNPLSTSTNFKNSKTKDASGRL